MRRPLMLLAILLLPGCDGLPTDAVSSARSQEITTSTASGFGTPTGGGPQSVVVTLRPGVHPRDVAAEYGVDPRFVYSRAVNGFAGSMSTLARSRLHSDARVAHVEPDREFRAHGGVQGGAPWGLDRVDQRDNALDGTYHYTATGRGVTVYVIDTGIRYSHADFGGRASAGFDAFGGDGSDCYGHGTHVAGIVGGTTYGVAKEAGLVSVRVLDCEGGGTTSTVIAGLDWVAANATRPAVANLSLGGGGSDAVDAAVRRLIEVGVTVVVSAGNNGMSACFWSPARVPEAMTVGASSVTDEMPSWSNYGDCVDWYAPGVSILSAMNGDDTELGYLSGTSMAAPHTAGAAALFLQSHSAASVSDVTAALYAAATPHVIRAGKGPRASLLFTLGDGWDGGDEPTNSPPTADFETDCSDLTCSFTDRSVDADGTVTTWSWSFDSGSGSTEQNPGHTFAAAGTYEITLTVSDDDGAASTTRKTLTVSPTVNQAPVAEFTVSCSELTCHFSDESWDPDGTVVGSSWSFGDGATAESASPAGQTHTYPTSGSFTVSLRVTDDLGATHTISRDVLVGEEPEGVVLAVVGDRVKGRHEFDLSWTGLADSQASVYVNGVLSATVPNDGTYTLVTDGRGQKSYEFRVCDPVGVVCSDDVTVSF